MLIRNILAAAILVLHFLSTATSASALDQGPAITVEHATGQPDIQGHTVSRQRKRLVGFIPLHTPDQGLHLLFSVDAMQELRSETLKRKTQQSKDSIVSLGGVAMANNFGTHFVPYL